MHYHHHRDHNHHSNRRLDPTQALQQVLKGTTTSRPDQTRTDSNNLAYAGTNLAIRPSNPLDFYNNSSSPDIDFPDP